ncbi:MAG: DUF1284 domain-containing protein [Clostridiales bacterium]|nr:DUF1284 domain-containing protein [Clostridiales bacterium]
MRPVRLRPHHGLCSCFFQGRGYSPAFAANMERVLLRLRENPAREVELVIGPDVLCAACPHRVSAGCETADKADRYDCRCLAACGLENGSVLQWGLYRRIIAEKILLPGRRKMICGDCVWNEICQQPVVEYSVENVEKCLKNT